jgi:hypothetical protein
MIEVISDVILEGSYAESITIALSVVLAHKSRLSFREVSSICPQPQTVPSLANAAQNYDILEHHCDVESTAISEP